jgi:hypothetical protein
LNHPYLIRKLVLILLVLVGSSIACRTSALVARLSCTARSG